MRKSKAYYIELLKEHGLWQNSTFRYQMLDRMRMDCGSYIRFGGLGYRRPSVLWADDTKLHIELMRALYHTFDVKPEWISLEDIAWYDREFKKLSKRLDKVGLDKISKN